MSGVIQFGITYDVWPSLNAGKALTLASWSKTLCPLRWQMLCASHGYIHWVAVCTQEYLMFSRCFNLTEFKDVKLFLIWKIAIVANLKKQQLSECKLLPRDDYAEYNNVNIVYFLPFTLNHILSSANNTLSMRIGKYLLSYLLFLYPIS